MRTQSNAGSKGSRWLPMLGAAASLLAGGSVSATEPRPPEAVELSATDASSAAAPLEPLMAAPTPDDLALLGESYVGSQTRPRLNLYGFADATFNKPWIEKSSVAAALYGAESSFLVGHLNVYLDSTISNSVRSLAEVRFTYLPQSNMQVGSDGRVSLQRTTVSDPANYRFSAEWGGIVIERAYLEYTHADWLSVRVGQYLTPYGIWVTDHGSPVVVGIYQPFVVGMQFFPERQTGLMATGGLTFGEARLAYYLTVSNGRGPVQNLRDLDNNKALGGRLELTGRWLGTLQLGVSGYRGRYTDYESRLTQASDMTVSAVREVNVAYDEQSLGLDLRWEWQGLLLASEFVRSENVFLRGGRPDASFQTISAFPVSLNISDGTSAPDTLGRAGYLLLGYRTPWWNLMPFYLGEYVTSTRRMASELKSLTLHTVGLNARVLPEVVMKVQYLYIMYDAAGDSSVLGNQTSKSLSCQVAWLF